MLDHLGRGFEDDPPAAHVEHARHVPLPPRQRFADRPPGRLDPPPPHPPLQPAAQPAAAGRRRRRSGTGAGRRAAFVERAARRGGPLAAEVVEERGGGDGLRAARIAIRVDPSRLERASRMRKKSDWAAPTVFCDGALCYEQ